MFYYSVCGFKICSEILLSSFHSTAPCSNIDLLIQIGETPLSIKDPVHKSNLHEISSHEYLLKIPETGIFYLNFKDKQLTVNPDNKETLNGIELFITGSCLGAFLIYNKLYPLHASSILTDKGAVLLCGRAGAGKSTSAFALNRMYGFELLSDDISPVSLYNNKYCIKPFIKRVKLWSKTLNECNIAIDSLEKVNKIKDKYFININKNEQRTIEYYKIDYIINLNVEISKNYIYEEIIKEKEKFKIIIDNSYRSYFYTAFNKEELIFKYNTGLLKSIKMYNLTRPSNSTIKETVEYLNKVICESR